MNVDAEEEIKEDLIKEIQKLKSSNSTSSPSSPQ